MYYNNTDTKTYTESEIKALYPNTSFPSPFVAPEEFSVIFDTPKPTVTELQIAYQDGTELDSKGNRVVKWSIRDMFADYTDELNIVHTKLEQETAYTFKLAQDAETALITRYTEAVEAHLNMVAKSKGYNSIDTACSYAAAINPFQAESLAFVGWRGRIWMQSYSIMAEVKAGTRVLPSVEVFILELEAYA